MRHNEQGPAGFRPNALLFNAKFIMSAHRNIRFIDSFLIILLFIYR